MHRAQSRVMNFMVQNVTEFRDVPSNDNVYTSYLHMLRISFSKKQHMSSEHILYVLYAYVFFHDRVNTAYMFLHVHVNTLFLSDLKQMIGS